MKNLKILNSLALVAVLIFTSLSLSLARDNTRPLSGPLRKSAGTPKFTMVNINNVSMWIGADGQSANNPVTGGSGGFFPRGNPVGVIFADGLVWSGLVQDGQLPVLRAGGQTFAIGTVPGRIISKGIGEDPNAADVRIWRVRRDFATANLRPDAADIFDVALGAVTEADEERIRDQYSKDWLEWPAEKGAPFYDSDGDGSYTPQLNNDGTPVLFPDADEPGIADADQVVWFVANDLSPAATAGIYGSPPIGLEMQATLWGYARTDALGFVIFKRYRLIYKGTEDTPEGATIEEMYFAQWSDPDLGSFGDDFVGNDPDASLGYVYNSAPVDAAFDAFGLPPPAAGYDFFAGPIIESPGDTAIFDLKRRPGFKNLGMSSFAFFAAGTDISDPPLGTYEGTLQWRNLHLGLTPAGGVPFFDPNDPVQVACGPFTLCGDPVTGEGWIDSGPADRRMVLNTGPFTMALGDTQEITLAFLAAMGADHLSSISRLRAFDVAAQQAFDDLFVLAKPPPKPSFTLSGLDQKIVINWGEDLDGVAATEDPEEKKGFVFEGYNVYQLRTASSTLADAVKLATFDLDNGVKTILDAQIDDASGVVVSLPSQVGFDTGIKRFLLVAEDAVNGGPIINNRSYFFAVTAYNYNDTTDVDAIHSLESSLSIRSVIPQSQMPGERLPVDSLGNTITVESVVAVARHSAGISDGGTIVIAVDPSKFTGHTYKVVFDTTAEGEDSWDLLDLTDNVTVLEQQTNQSGDDDYLITDGIMVKVLGAALDFKQFLITSNAAGPIDPPISADWYRDVLEGPGIPDVGQTAGGLFFIVAGGPSITSYSSAVGRWTRGGDRFSVLIPNDYEIRFTEAGGKASMAFTTETLVDVPYEIWFIGSGTPDDPSDDVRMIPWMFDDNENDIFDFKLDHEASGGDNDPYSDWIYFRAPQDFSVGEAGYNQFVADAEAGTYDFDSPEHLARTVIMNWNQHQNESAPGAGDGPVNAMPETGTTFRIVMTKPNVPGVDEFTFTVPTSTSSAELAKSDIGLINVFPNPYLGFSSIETNRFNRFVRFTHLPQEVTIRIFNLAGVHVRTLKKVDDNQLLDWDLKNENELPVASGIYIAFLSDMKDVSGSDLGVRTLKLAIVMERQFLENF